MGYEPAGCAQPFRFLCMNRLIHLIEPDERDRYRIAGQIGVYGYAVNAFASTAEASAASKMDPPAVVIMPLPGDDSADLEYILQIQEGRDSFLPFLFVVDSDTMAKRLNAVRLGGRGFFLRPLDMEDLVDSLDRLTDVRPPDPYRVLVAEPDPALAQDLAAVLESAGMAVRTVSAADHVLDAAAELRPELLLVDMYFPNVLGMELASLIRQDPRFGRVPIVFHAADNHARRQVAALRRGGDGFLQRPVAPGHLVLSVSSRIERFRAVDAITGKDSLTGLPNHTTMQAKLEKMIAAARHHQGRFALVIVDIDKFKKVNDTYGHAAGDRVIKSLGRLLRQRMDSSDFLGRHAGEEFAAVIRTTDPMTTARVFNEIRIDFSHIVHTQENREFFASISCGVAPFPRYASAGALVDAAERAVRVSKDKGGNRVVIYRPKEGTPNDA